MSNKAKTRRSRTKNGPSRPFTVLRPGSGGKWSKQPDHVAAEEPLEIRLRGRSLVVTMRTPGHDRELAAGFLLSEGIIRKRRDVIDIAPAGTSDEPENILNVFPAADVAVDFERHTRHVFASSSCGLCGKASIDAVHQYFPPVNSKVAVPVKTLFSLPEQMRKAQRTFAQTGGLHAAALFNARGKMMVLREDIGRHNAVDKVLGYAFLKDKLPSSRHILMVSGRASFEIMQKALSAGVPIVCAVSAPSSLAVEFAQQSGQTLVGFLRAESMNVYSSPERIVN